MINKMKPAELDQCVKDYAMLFDKLSVRDIDTLDKFYAPEVHFKDPFNDVVGVVAIKAIFRHMFKSCEESRFEILGFSSKGDTGYINWLFHCTTTFLGTRHLNIDGMSRVRFNASGLVVEHIDYWDSAEGVYEDIPILGSVLRIAKKRASVKLG